MTESKFNECVRTQSKRLYLIALSFTKNQADAEEMYALSDFLIMVFVMVSEAVT